MEFLLGVSLTNWLVGAVIAIATYFWYNCIFNHFWKINNVPADNPLSNFKLLIVNLKKEPLFRIYESIYKKHGRIYGIYQGSCPVLLVSQPELLRDILVKDFPIFSTGRQLIAPEEPYDKMLLVLQGEEWKRMRTILTPVFTSGKIRKLAIYINQASETAKNSLLKSAGTNVDLKSTKMQHLAQIFPKLTLSGPNMSTFGHATDHTWKFDNGLAMDIIASTAFATQLDSINNPDNPFVTNAKHVLDFHYSWRGIATALAPGIMKAFNINMLSPEIAEFFCNLIHEIRNRRSKEGKSPNDFLQMLIEAESETANDDRQLVGGHFTTDQEDIKRTTKRTLTPDELVSQCLMWFLGGYHTTSTTIALLCYNLAREPECQEKLLNEVDEMWEKHEQFDVDVINSMKYLDAVVCESLRFYPAGARLIRTCGEDYQLGDTGITIPKGTSINVPVYALHHDPEFFPDPDTFNPDRFLPENKHLIQPYTYMPFGTGPRSCIAMRFSLMVVKICLANVLRHVSFHVGSQTKYTVNFSTGVGLIQPKEVIVKVERRVGLH